jgi:hypothetical protein
MRSHSPLHTHRVATLVLNSQPSRWHHTHPADIAPLQSAAYIAWASSTGECPACPPRGTRHASSSRRRSNPVQHATAQRSSHAEQHSTSFHITSRHITADEPNTANNGDTSHSSTFVPATSYAVQLAAPLPPPPPHLYTTTSTTAATTTTSTTAATAATAARTRHAPRQHNTTQHNAVAKKIRTGVYTFALSRRLPVAGVRRTC